MRIRWITLLIRTVCYISIPLYFFLSLPQSAGGIIAVAVVSFLAIVGGVAAFFFKLNKSDAAADTTKRHHVASSAHTAKTSKTVKTVKADNTPATQAQKTQEANGPSEGAMSLSKKKRGMYFLPNPSKPKKYFTFY